MEDQPSKCALVGINLDKHFTKILSLEDLAGEAILKHGGRLFPHCGMRRSPQAMMQGSVVRSFGTLHSVI